MRLGTVLLISGCAAVPISASRAVVWNKTDTPNADCVAAGAPKLLIGAYRGCAKWRSDPCVIYAPDARNKDDRRALATLGEEFKHCMDGEFHRETL